MNTTPRAAFQVGLLMIAALILFVGGWVFFNGQFRKSNTYKLDLIFSDAQGIGKQDPVQLAGVHIGQVALVGLTPDGRSARVVAEIDKKWHIPLNSAFSISSSPLGGTAVVNITPPPPDPRIPIAFIPQDFSGPIYGQPSFTLASFASQAAPLFQQFGKTAASANTLLTESTKTVRALNKLAASGQLQNSLQSTLGNLQQASNQGLELTHDLRAALLQDNKMAQVSIANINSTTGSLRDAANDNKAQLSQLVANLNATTAHFANLSEQANASFTRNGTAQTLADTVTNLKDSTTKLNQILTNVQGLTGDAGVQADLKATVHNAAVASANTGLLLARLNQIAGGHTHGAGTAAPSGPPAPPTLVRLDLRQNLQASHFRADLNIYAPFGPTNFARIGLFDITGYNRGTLQYGALSAPKSQFSYRAGIYEGKIGVGADYGLFGNHTTSLDLYDPNHLKLNATQRIPITKGAALIVGLDDVLRSDAFSVGLELGR